MMTLTARRSRQPQRLPWSAEELLRRRAIALGMALDGSSHATYSSALNSYLSFCEMHNFPIDPTPDTLSFFVVYMSAHIEPRSVGNYLSGICHELEAFFPNVRSNRRHMLVSRTLQGCKRLHSKPTTRKLPLPASIFTFIDQTMPTPATHDQLLFVAMIKTGFRGLMRLGELTAPDNSRLYNPAKFTLRSSVEWLAVGFALSLPAGGHKTDKSFEGARIIIAEHPRTQVHAHFQSYLAHRDASFPFNPYLWITSAGNVPTRQWFLRRLHALVDNRAFAGQSMHAGGATFLAECGVATHLIQACGRWSSDTFRIYIRKNPVLLQVILENRRSRGTP